LHAPSPFLSLCPCPRGTPCSPQDAYNKNLRLSAGRCPARAVMARLLPLVRAKKFDCTFVITHRLPLSDGVRGYDIFARRAEGCIKVVLDPWA
jgi:threonine dehydrogenase-like Zn-dependent dehydrogenase